jgi:hypothetical protein
MNYQLGKTTISIVIISVVIFCSCLYYCYKSSQNYCALHIVASNDSQSMPGMKVALHSPHGTTLELKMSPHTVGLFEQPWNSGVSQISITADHLEPEMISQITVLCGQNVVGPTRQLKIHDYTPINLDQLPKDWKNGFTLQVEPLSRSLLPTPSKCINWQGDTALLIVAAIRSFLAIASFGFMYFLLLKVSPIQSFHKSFSRYFYYVRRVTISEIAVSPIATGLIIYLLLQATVFFNWFFIPTEINQLLIALLAVLSPIFATAILLRWTKQKSTAQIHVLATTTILCIFLIKLLWIFCSPTINIGDYAIYWQHACTMATNNWLSLEWKDNPLQTIYVTRAYPYFYPIAYFFGIYPGVVSFANLATQTLTLLLWYIFACRTLTPRLSAATLPLLISFPDFWFGMTIATHDIPSIFFLVLSFLLTDLLANKLSFLSKTEERSNRPLLLISIIALIVLLGLSIGLSDVQRGYLPLWTAWGLTLSILFGISENRKRSTQKNSLSCLPWLKSLSTCLLVVCCSLVSAKIISTSCIARTPEMGTQSTFAHVAGIDTALPPKWNNTSTWSWAYYPAISPDDRLETTLRKFCYERLTKAVFQWWQFDFKLTEYSDSSFTMMQAVAREKQTREGEDRISWYQSKFAFCAGFPAFMALFSIYRFLIIPKTPLMKGEIITGVFSLTGLGILLLSVDAVPVYDIFINFSIVCAAVISLNKLTNRTYKVTTCDLAPSLAFLTKGLATLLVLFTTHCLLASIFFPHGTFFRTLERIRANPDGSLLDNFSAPVINSDAASFSISFPQQISIEKQQIVETSAIAEVNPNDSKELRFFISGAQRSRMHPEKDEWQDVPMNYSVYLDGQSISEGTVSDLASPRFFSLPLKPDQLNRSLPIVLRLNAKSGYLNSPTSIRPELSVEFFH